MAWRRLRDASARGPMGRMRKAHRTRLSRFAGRRVPRWAEVVLGGLWIALLAFVVGYVGLKGETAMAELDGLDLVAVYALEP